MYNNATMYLHLYNDFFTWGFINYAAYDHKYAVRVLVYINVPEISTCNCTQEVQLTDLIHVLEYVTSTRGRKDL